MRYSSSLLALALCATTSLAHAQGISDVQLKPGSSALWGAQFNYAGRGEVSLFNTTSPSSVADSFRFYQGPYAGNQTLLQTLSPTGSVFGAATGGAQGPGTINTQGVFVNGVSAITGLGGTSGQIQYNNAGVLGGFTTSGDATINTGTGALTLATVNGNVGTFGSATACITTTQNAKGLTTAISAATCTPAIGSITGLGTGVAIALGVNIGTAGAFIVNGGVGGTPSSLIGTNITGTAAGLTVGDVANAPVIAKVLTGYVSGSGTVSAADSILSAIQKLDGNNGLVPILPVLTASSSASLTATTQITSAYSSYQFVIQNLVPATNSVTMLLQVSEDGGGTYKTATYLDAAGGTTGIAIGGNLIDNTAGVGVSASVTISGLALTDRKKMASGKSVTMTGGAAVTGNIAGWFNGDNGAINAVRFIPSSGSISTGQVFIYGIK